MIGKKLIPKIVKNYTDYIREPVQKHREITARKFQTRIDYVDLSAFGVGVNFDDVDHFKEGSKKIEEEISRYSSEYGRLNSKLQQLDKKLEYFMF